MFAYKCYNHEPPDFFFYISPKMKHVLQGIGIDERNELEEHCMLMGDGCWASSHAFCSHLLKPDSVFQVIGLTSLYQSRPRMSLDSPEWLLRPVS